MATHTGVIMKTWELQNATPYIDLWKTFLYFQRVDVSAYYLMQNQLCKYAWPPICASPTLPCSLPLACFQQFAVSSEVMKSNGVHLSKPTCARRAIPQGWNLMKRLESSNEQGSKLWKGKLCVMLTEREREQPGLGNKHRLMTFVLKITKKWKLVEYVMRRERWSLRIVKWIPREKCSRGQHKVTWEGDSGKSAGMGWRPQLSQDS